MLFIDTNFETRDCSLYDVIDAIDGKILQLSLKLLNSKRFGFDSRVDLDLYEDLVIYKDIIENIMYCSQSMCDSDILAVVSKVRQLTNSIC